MGKYKLEKFIVLLSIFTHVLYLICSFIGWDHIFLIILWVIAFTGLLCACVVIKGIRKKVLLFILIIFHIFLLVYNQSCFEVIHVAEIEGKKIGIINFVEIERCGDNVKLISDKNKTEKIEYEKNYEFIFEYSPIHPTIGKLIKFREVN